MSDKWICENCGTVGLVEGNDGFFYCTNCSTRAEDYQDTGVADEDFYDKDGDARGGLYSNRHVRRGVSSAVKPEPLSQPLDNISPFYNPFSQTKTEDHNAVDAKGPTGPTDFGLDGIIELSVEDYYTQIRLRYVMGLQRLIELQCEALVRKFKVNPTICGLSATIWLRFLAGTRLFDDDWADSEMCRGRQGDTLEGFKPRANYRAEPHTKYGQRAVMVWFRSLRNTIPLSYTLAVSFLACHLSREAVLPTDIVKWSLEGNLPYFSAFLQIEKELGGPSRACPISSSLMFRPTESVPVQKLESLAATISESIGLHLPPVNFYAIALRYLGKLSLPVEKILPHACRIYEWSMPPDLWLSTNEFRLPTRAFVMSIVIVAVRILYNIHGFGEWEKCLSRKHALSSTSNQKGDLDTISSSKMRSGSEEDSGSPSRSLDDLGTDIGRNSSNAQSSELDAAELLSSLEARYNEIADSYEYCKDLPTYLQFCKDVVFAGSKSSLNDEKEEELIESLWEFYQSGKDSETAAGKGLFGDRDVEQKRLRDSDECASDGTPFSGDHQGNKTGDHSCASSQNSQCSGANDAETLKDEAIRRMKLDMEEKRFCYIPPRVNLKRFDYLHYVRKKDEGAYTYVAHADYYILLRACARVAQVEIRCMHIAVLSIERRLAWLEKRINHCLHLTPPVVSCEYCTEMFPDAENNIGESID
ncbi:TATA box-binding protein-associated factor RNA polymerase I subunit B [Pyrus ussuriensis x Pyrus communis]|uniref:TATA box-binding protein-associated factor RNA polymerase I subunit B n=1 Tax=Pyrus ussuriensis x Pyrus communis TaxID=2448454 RepID=A0A5N5H543_9ROSA|nr:TATA box-binding protein-associated factor RNA polymerase I subunit B [Pyrus ussuriensis x Pyrus communis]